MSVRVYPISMSNIPNMSVIYTVDLCSNRYTAGFLDGMYACFLLGLGACIYILIQRIHSKEETVPIVINVYTNKDEEECCDCEKEEEEEEEEEAQEEEEEEEAQEEEAQEEEAQEEEAQEEEAQEETIQSEEQTPPSAEIPEEKTTVVE